MDIQEEKEAFLNVYVNYKGDSRKISFSEETEQFMWRKNNVSDTEVEYVHLMNQQWYAWLACVKSKAQAVPEWISVGDSLPPVDEAVLVCWDYAADIEPEKEYLTLDEDYNEYWPNCQDEPPTHWLPLPKVIKAQEPAK